MFGDWERDCFQPNSARLANSPSLSEQALRPGTRSRASSLSLPGRARQLGKEGFQVLRRLRFHGWFLQESEVAGTNL